MSPPTGQDLEVYRQQYGWEGFSAVGMILQTNEMPGITAIQFWNPTLIRATHGSFDAVSKLEVVAKISIRGCLYRP